MDEATGTGCGGAAQAATAASEPQLGTGTDAHRSRLLPVAAALTVARPHAHCRKLARRAGAAAGASRQVARSPSRSIPSAALAAAGSPCHARCRSRCILRPPRP
eukprot:scaffold11166_cov101-Isochrysis_galbana.AAC.2